MPACVVTIHGQDETRLLREVVSMLTQRHVRVRALSAVLGGGESRLHIDAEVDGERGEELLLKRLNRIVGVLKVTVNDSTSAHLITSTVVVVDAASNDSRTHVLELARALGAEVLEIAESSVALSLAATPAKRREFLSVLETFGIAELAEGGPVAVHRVRRKANARAQAPQLKVVSA